MNTAAPLTTSTTTGLSAAATPCRCGHSSTPPAADVMKLTSLTCTALQAIAAVRGGHTRAATNYTGKVSSCILEIAHAS